MRSPNLSRGQILEVKEFRDIHTDYYKGIYVPAGTDTAVSIRFKAGRHPEWEYTDRWVEVGRLLDYTGQGPPERDQSLNTRFNAGLVNAEERESPVAVFEALESRPRTFRYWGHGKVDSHYSARSTRGHIVWRFKIDLGEIDR